MRRDKNATSVPRSSTKVAGTIGQRISGNDARLPRMFQGLTQLPSQDLVVLRDVPYPDTVQVSKKYRTKAH